MNISDKKFIELLNSLSEQDKQELYEILLIMVKYRKLKKSETEVQA